MKPWRNVPLLALAGICLSVTFAQDATEPSDFLTPLAGGLSRPVIPPIASPVEMVPVQPDGAVEVPAGPDADSGKDEKVYIEPPPPVVGGAEPTELGATPLGVPDPVRAPEPGNKQESMAQSSEDFLRGLSTPIDLQGLETSYDSTTGLVSAAGNVVVSYQGMEMRADRVRYHPESGEVTADGNVMLSKDKRVFLTESASWNTTTGRIYTRDFRGDLTPFIYEAKDVRTTETAGAVVETEGAFVTTHDDENPNWHMSAKRMTVTPGDKVVLRDVTFYSGNTPIFWLPVYHQPLQEGAGYVPMPGYKSDWGAFLLNTYGVVLGDHTLAQYKFDIYQERGFGMGVDLSSLRYRNASNKLPFGNLRLYYINDWDPKMDPSGIPRTVNVDPQRYRVNFQHRIYLPGPEESDLYVDIDLNKISDEYLYRDFFPSEYQLDPQPENQISLIQRFTDTEMSLWTRFQANKFFPTETRLPEFAVDTARSPLGKTGLFYEATSSVGIYEQELSRTEERAAQYQLDRATNPDVIDELRAQLSGEGFRRLHSYHQISYPTQFGGWLNVIPRVGAGITRYDDIEGYRTPDSDTRTMLHAGVDFGFKFIKTYPKIHSDYLGIKELRHIVNPYANLSFFDISDIDQNIVGIDPLIATTRPRPLDPSLHTAIEGLSSWHALRLGVLNTLKTKRGTAASDWLSLNTYFDVFFEDPELDRTVSNLYNDLRWSPVSWLSVGILSQLPLESDGFFEANSYIKWMPTPNLEMTINSLVLQDNPFFDDSNRLFSTIYWQFSDKWGVYARHVYEIETGVLETQSYMLMHDFQTWTAGLGGQIRDSGIVGAEQEYSILLMFTLKDFPRVSVPFEFNAPDSGSP